MDIKLGDIKQRIKSQKALEETLYLLERRDDWKSAVLILRENYNFAEKERNLLGQAIISNSLGKLFAKQKGDENFSLAHMYFTNSIKLGKIVEDEEHLYKAYLAWGRALMHNGRPESALIELNRAFEIEEKLGNFHRLQTILLNMTNIFTRLGKHSEILAYVNRAVAATNNHPALIKYRETTVKSMSFSKTPSLRKKNS
jgi:tetratricopeptide (TPR) repeat protein